MSPFCSICPLVRGRNPIPMSGPAPCRILFLLEAPHKTEDQRGYPACGKTGVEFDNSYLPIPGLYRDDVAVYNSVCCSQPSYRNPTPEEAAVCSAHHLPSILARVRPEIIVTMGAVSASLFPGLSLPLHHGIPQPAQYGDWSGIVFPTFHPSAGLHSTAYMIPLRKDFAALKEVLHQLDQGTFSWPSDPYPNPDYKILHTVHDLSAYLDDGHHFDIGTDTEFSSHGVHCLTFSHAPGTGALIYASATAPLKAYASYLRAFNPLLHFHAYLADVDPYATLGIPIPPRRFSDTMIRAYNLGIGGGGDEEDSGSARGSLGLKVLTSRHLHMKMKSFNDLVTPHALPLVYDYLAAAHALLSEGYQLDPEPICTCGHPQKEHKAKGKSARRTGWCEHESTTPVPGTFEHAWGVCECEKFTLRPSRKPDRLTSTFLRKITHLSSQTLNLALGLSAGEKPVDPWKRVQEWHEWEKTILLECLGPLPEKRIELVPEGELVHYACQDADGTLRLARFLDTYRP